MTQSVFRNLEPFRRHSRAWRTAAQAADRQTDRQTDIHTAYNVIAHAALNYVAQPETTACGEDAWYSAV